MVQGSNIHERKLELIQWISTIDDDAVIDQIDQVREGSTNDWWDEISADEKEMVLKGIAAADAGDLIPHSEVLKRYEKWL